jgi:hypothetical protein
VPITKYSNIEVNKKSANNKYPCINGDFTNVAQLLRTIVRVTASGNYWFYWGVMSKYTAFFINDEDLQSYSSTLYKYQSGSLNIATMHSVAVYLEKGKTYALEGYAYFVAGAAAPQDFAVSFNSPSNPKIVEATTVLNGATVTFDQPVTPVAISINPSSGPTYNDYGVV